MKTIARIQITGTLAAMALAGLPAQDQGKFAVEAPIKAGLAKDFQIDLAKRLVERPLKNRLDDGSEFVDRKVSAGLVRWHPTYEAAKKRAKISGNPVLLFQLLGKLDDAFC